MGYDTTIEFTQDKFKKIKDKKDLYALLTPEQIGFLDEWYLDLQIIVGHMTLDDLTRHNYHSENWAGIVKEIAKFEGEEFAVVFRGLDEAEGYKGTPEGEVLGLRVTEKWVAPEEGDKSKRFWIINSGMDGNHMADLNNSVTQKELKPLVDEARGGIIGYILTPNEKGVVNILNGDT